MLWSALVKLVGGFLYNSVLSRDFLKYMNSITIENQVLSNGWNSRVQFIEHRIRTVIIKHGTYIHIDIYILTINCINWEASSNYLSHPKIT